jgi:CheY-like chemotaxis protein
MKINEPYMPGIIVPGRLPADFSLHQVSAAISMAGSDHGMTQAERTYRLLIVDDDETGRRLHGWLLARQAPGAFEIEQEKDGSAGIAAPRERKFDCLLLDFSLPGVTGLEFLAEAATDGELPCAVVPITGHANEAITVDAMKLGVQDYLVKDHVNEGRLWRAIVRAVSRRELRLGLASSMRALTTANATLEKAVAAHKQTEAELRAANEAAEQATSSGPGSRVLLVDDIAINRDVTGAFPRASGHEVVLAENGQDAIGFASEQNFDLILMDVRMPEMDGLEATRRIGARSAPYARGPILALTAYFFPGQIPRCRLAG